jgi:uncharacterized MAPEG superfamily protein
MTVAEWCLFGTVILYLGTLAPAKALGHSEFDNADPRNPQFYEHPMRKRAFGAHINGIETFPFFAVAVVLAEFRQAPQHWVDLLATAFLISRVGFVVAYLADKPTARTVLWNVAMAFNIGLFFLAGFDPRGAIIATAVALAWAISLWPLLSRIQRPRPR